MKQKVKAFIGVLTARINHTEADAEHIRIVNQMNEADPGTDGGLIRAARIFVHRSKNCAARRTI